MRKESPMSRVPEKERTNWSRVEDTSGASPVACSGSGSAGSISSGRCCGCC